MASDYGLHSPACEAAQRPGPPLVGKPLLFANRVSYTETRKDFEMRRTVAAIIVLALSWTALSGSEGSTWNRLRYAGGTVQVKVNPYDYNTTLKITSDEITLSFTHSKTVVHIKPDQVTSLSYGQEAHRRVADVVALSVVLSPLALFGLLHVSKDHFIGIVYHTEDGKPAAVLLEADKTNYWLILQVLKGVTGKPVDKAP
jgi:hypothetical protein